MACVKFGSLCFMAGATVDIDFQYLEDDGITPIPLPGATAELSLLNAVQDVSSVINFSGGINDEPNGSGRFSLNKTQSQSLLPIGNAEPKISFKGTIKFTFVDTSVDFPAGFDFTFEQNASR